MNNLFAILFLLIITFIGCKEDTLNPVPEIQLEYISNSTIHEFVDSIIIQIRYTDGDGDLGHLDSDSNSLYVQDERLSYPDKYFIPLLSPPEAKVSITGNLTIHLRNTFLLGNGGEEQTKFRIRVKDRSGNWSNEVSTPQITILP